MLCNNGIQAGVRFREARFGQRLWRDHVPVAVFIRCREQGIDIGLQAFLHGRLGTVAECRVEGEAGGAQETGEYQGGSQQQSAVQGTHQPLFASSRNR